MHDPLLCVFLGMAIGLALGIAATRRYWKDRLMRDAIRQSKWN
jgi:uncharacterized protein YneF (UPF0154 family)